MSDEQARPEFKYRTETPERVLLSIKVSFEAKARWVWLAEAMSLSITKTLETMAERWEAATLKRLRPKDRQRYLEGTLGDTVVVFDGRKFRRNKIDAPDETTVLSAKITVEARDQLVRYATLKKMSLAAVLDRLSVNLEKTFRRQEPPPEPRPALDENMASRMMPSEEDA